VPDRGASNSLRDTSLVVLCFNRLDEVALNVPPRIADVLDHGLELVVVDNASTDGTVEYLTNLRLEQPHFTLILNPTNAGVGRGRNTGWAETTREFVVTVDEDTRIASTELIALVDHLASTPAAGIITPVMFHPSDGRLMVPVLAPPGHVTTFLGGCYATRRALIETVGSHDPLCDFGGEELDLSIRARNAGWSVMQHPSLRVAHNGLAHSGVENRWRRARWTQNHARVMWRWFPYRSAFVWSFLNVLGQLRSAVRRKDFRALPMLVRAWSIGAAQGVRIHQPVRHEVVEFYRRRLGLRAVLVARRTSVGLESPGVQRTPWREAERLDD
jgi:GT2 family glycosyltransferase